MLVHYEIPDHLVQEVNEAVRRVLEFKSKQSTGFIPFYQDGHLFTSQAEYDDYKKRVDERNANLSQWLQEFETKGEVLEPGQIDCRTFTTDDLYFFWVFGPELSQYVGPRAVENRMINSADAGTFPNPEFPFIGPVNQELLRGQFDWGKYRGVLYDVLKKHRGGNF
jgi:hypothetical protein